MRNPKIPASEEVPEPDCHQEHDRPAREWRARTRLPPRPELQETPRLHRQESQGDDLRRREERAHCHVLGGRTREIQVVHGPDHTPAEYSRMSRKMTVRATSYHTEKDEDVGDHDGGEELQKILHPQVHDPEAPEVRGREVGLGPGEQPDGVEGRDGQGGEEEQPGHVCRVLPPQPSAQAPEQHSHPEEEADGEQDLPEASQVKVLEALVAEPGPKIAREAEDPQDTCPQPHRDTHQQKGSLVASGEYAREKLRGDKREHKEDRHHRERSGKEGYGIPASANLHLLILVRRSRKPALTWRWPVKSMPAMGGPATHASMGTPPDTPTAMTRSMPLHEIANVRAKKVRSG